MIEAFYSKKMSINIKKSGYMIINGKEADVKCGFKLKAGWLKYKDKHKYLGAILTQEKWKTIWMHLLRTKAQALL